MGKKIASIRVVKPGSSPDIDSDFNTEYRERAIEYVTNLYGKNNVSNILTFNTMAAKGALKNMCTIYEIPFKEANDLVSLIPGPEDGKELTLKDIFNPEHHRYSESEDFRDAVSSSRWENILSGAMAVEGKNKTTGVHACGIIISSKELDSVIPMQVRKEDSRYVTQWTYQECESLGLIKMDFLGLDTVDLIQATVENIMKNGKTPPNMTQLIHGSLDDKDVFSMFREGHTVGIFQFGSDMVRELLKRMKPTHFDDLVACTAVARPGPMGMKAHEKYADRKNGLEEVDYIHPDFNGSELVEILQPTHGLVLFQESVTKIANQIAGMTLQEGDDLRKAMGKKKADVMKRMKPKFIEGGVANGFSEEAMTTLWEVLEPFSLYAFNKSHSVAYSLNAYQSAYLKAHFPVEFMSALIQQHISKRDKTLQYLQEAKRMGLTVVPPNVNTSDVTVTPDKNDTTDTIMTFGLGAIKGVGLGNAKIIVDECNANGEYTSLKDLITRVSPLGVNKGVFIALIHSGALDDFHDNRNAMIDCAEREIKKVHKNKNKGSSLFDMFDVDEGLEEYDSSIVETFSERISKEADAIGLYLTSHPVEHVRKRRGNNLATVTTTTERKTFYVPASCVSMTVKRGRGRVSYRMTIEDLTGTLDCYVPKNVVKRWDKYTAQQQVLSFVEKEKDGDIKPEIVDKAFDDSTYAQPRLEVHKAALFKITTGGFGGARLVDIYPLYLSHDGSNASKVVIPVSYPPARREKEKQRFVQLLRDVEQNCPGSDSLLVSFVPDMRKKSLWGERVNTPPMIFDDFAIRNAMAYDIIDKEEGKRHLRSAYSLSPLNKCRSEFQENAVIDEFHRVYPVDTELEFFVDSNHKDLPYLLDEIAGSGNFYL